MPSVKTIELIFKRVLEHGVKALTPAERKVWLILEAEVLCDMEGIDSFLDSYSGSLLEVADAFAEVGASQIAESLRSIHAHLPIRSDELLNLANSLVTARTGYDYDSILRLASRKV